MKAGRALQASVPVFTGVGINTVPVTGLVVGGWPAETMLVIYVVETVLLVAITTLRLRLFAPARLVTSSGRLQPRSEAIRGFALFTGGFALVGGVFSAFLVAPNIDLALTQRALFSSITAFLIVQAIALLFDWLLLREVSQDQAEGWMLPGMRRGCVLFGTIFLAMFAMGFGFSWYIYVFVGLKLLMDIGIMIEEVQARLSGLRRPEAVPN